MKWNMRTRRLAALFWILLFVVYSVAAIGVTVLDASEDRYVDLSRVSLVTVHATEEQRSLGAAQMAAVYRAQSGAPFASLPPGTTVQIVWPDGSSEYVVVTNPAASDGTTPIPGTRRSADAPLSNGVAPMASPVSRASPLSPQAPAHTALEGALLQHRE